MCSRLQPDSLREINAICDRYEDVWLSGQTPSLADYTIDEDSNLARQLFADLLDLHLHYCRKQNLDPHLPTIESKLPQFRKLLEKKAEEFKASSERDTVDQSAVVTFQSNKLVADGNVVDAPQLSRYEILDTLGSGAMGTVYLAEDKALGRKVALKTPSLTEQTSGSVERFFREAKAAAGLHHRSICPVFDVGQEGNTLFLTMAYIKGRPLNALIKSGAVFSTLETARILQQIAVALQAAHAQGVVHRDLKPANIMIDHENQPVVMDFGLARQSQLEDATQLTQSGMILGTPAYMSPEQLQDSASAGPAADIYSLGVVMYQIMTGELPFQGSIMTVVTKILSQPAPRPSERERSVDNELERICLKAMAKDPADRFASMQDFAAALEPVINKHSKTSVQAPVAVPVLRTASRHPEETKIQPVRHSAGSGRLKRLTVFGSMLGLVAVLWGVILLIPSANGTIRIEVKDPDVHVLVNSTGAEVRGKRIETLHLKPGKQSFRIKRGEFEFETDNFVLSKYDQIQVMIEWLEGGLVATRDGNSMGMRVVQSPQEVPAESKSDGSDIATQVSRSSPGRSPQEFEDGNAILEYLRSGAGALEVTENKLGAYQGMKPEDDWTEVTDEPCVVYVSADFALDPANMAMLLARLPGLHSLAIAGRNFDPAALELITGSGIRKVSFERTNGLKQGVVEAITRMKTIDELHLYSCKLEDDDLERVCELTQLKTLQIGSNEITSAGYRHLSKLENLEMLLGSMPTEESEAAALLIDAVQNCKKLYHFSFCARPESDLSGLRRMTSLRKLELDTQDGPVKDLSVLVDTSIEEIVFEYDRDLHRNALIDCQSLQLINRIPKDEFLTQP